MQPYYDENGITIYHGDCREILPSLTGDTVITDPPYGVGLAYGEAYSDDREVYRRWIDETVKTILSCAPLALITPGIRNLWLYPQATWIMCWGKPGSTRRSDLGGFNEWEPVLVYGKRRIYNDFLRLPDCANHATDTGNHPCPKPLKLMQWLVAKASDADALVIDPFMGSGTTLRAAKNLGRTAIGIEIEERYCEIAVNRLAQEVLCYG